MIVSVFATGSASAEVSKKNQVNILASEADINNAYWANVYIDGLLMIFDQSALLVNGATMVPMRGIFEMLGASISWDAATKTVTANKDSNTIQLTLGSDIAFKSGEQIKLSAVPVSVKGSTLVPLRFVSEALGAAIEWDNETFTAMINSDPNNIIPIEFPPVNQLHLVSRIHISMIISRSTLLIK